MSRRSVQLLAVPLALWFALWACNDEPTRPTSTRQPADAPQLAIVDGRNGGVAFFRWLPPITATAEFPGTLVANAAPTVEVCVQGPTECVVFATSGANLPAVSVDKSSKAAPYFTVKWDTRKFSLDPAKAYRITVRRGAAVQGSADVDVVPNRAGLASVAPGYVGLVVGDVLDINFLIYGGRSRTWTGAAKKGSTTDWANPDNWTPAGVPLTLDTANIPLTTNKPVLAANTTAGAVYVGNGTTLSMGAFDLTLNLGAATTGTGRMTGTGKLVLAGTGTIGGVLPRLLVTGDYSLAADVGTPATARVQGGRLASAGRLFMVTP